MMYTLGAEPVGIYASRLERTWARWLQATHWRAVYVGDRTKVADFLLLPVGPAPCLLEVKPAGQSFLVAAARRLRGAGVGEALIVLGSPPFSSWFLLRPGSDRLRPCPSPGPPDRGPTGMAAYLERIRRVAP
jgi:hypothetical protein